MKKKITLLICISILVIFGGLYTYQQKKEAQEISARNEKVNSAIMDWVQPIASKYEIDMRVDESKTDYEYFVSHDECKQYYFISQAFDELSDDIKLDLLESLYEKLCPVGKDLYYCAAFNACISNGSDSYHLFVDKGMISLVEGNIVSSSIQRASEYAVERRDFLGLGGNDDDNSSSESSSKEKVICTMCNGTGQVKYYYGEGDDDYEFGPCTSCDEKGYVYIETHGEGRVTCPSCGNKVDNLVTRKDNAGVSRTWCSSCWSEYDEIMGN